MDHPAPAWIDAVPGVTDRSAAARALHAHDIFAAGATPAVVARPASVEELQGCVRAAAAGRAPITVRGGGASYTLGYTPAADGGLALDLSGLDRILAIDEAAMAVTVEAGVTWAALDAALAAKGLRAPFWGPYSGAVATVGGALSQHAISMGSGVYGASDAAVTALTVVDGAGGLVRTNRPDRPYLAAWGPNLTGLFLGDCGALGVKATATLRLMARPTHVAACSFAFPAFPAMAAAAMAVAARGLASEILGLDPEIQKGFLGQLTPRRFAATAAAIWSTAPNPAEGLATLARAALGARAYVRADSWACHFTAEGWSAAEVKAKVASIRALASRHGAEIANAAPLALRGAPFLPLSPILSPAGERWLPTHGVFRPGDLAAFHAAFEAWRARRQADFASHGVRLTRMVVPVGTSACVYEPTFYWPDGRHAVHEALAPAEHLARLPPMADRPDARAAVFAARAELSALMQAHGAQHFQLGKWYGYADRLDPGARALLGALKRALDPAGLFNPGALGLSPPER